MGIPLVRGRLFTDLDLPDHPRVVIVDEYMAAELWPGADPIGKRIRLGDARSTGPWQTVVGWSDASNSMGSIPAAAIALYLPHRQSPARAMYVVVRGAGDPSALAAATTKEIHGIDPDLPLYRVRPMTEWVDRSLARERSRCCSSHCSPCRARARHDRRLRGDGLSRVARRHARLGSGSRFGATQQAVVGMILRQGLSVTLAGTVSA